MDYRMLGASDLRVSEISLGSWLTFGAGVDRTAAEGCVQAALDAGINLIDTANVYGHGAAESFLGEVLRDVPRSRYLLATKVFFPMSATDRGLSAPQIRKQLDQSLQRLQVDHVDLYQCHRYDPATPHEETMAALDAAVRQGILSGKYLPGAPPPGDSRADQVRENAAASGVRLDPGTVSRVEDALSDP